jgi:hypothetical protein
VGHFLLGGWCDEVAEVAEVVLADAAEGDFVARVGDLDFEIADGFFEFGDLALEGGGLIRRTGAAGDRADVDRFSAVGEDRGGVGGGGQVGDGEFERALAVGGQVDLAGDQGPGSLH